MRLCLDDQFISLGPDMPLKSLGAIAIGVLAANPATRFDTATTLLAAISDIQQYRSNLAAVRRTVSSLPRPIDIS